MRLSLFMNWQRIASGRWQVWILLWAMGVQADLALAAAPGQPFASYWHPATLLNWNPATDPDAPFNRANTPLATQFLNPALNLNAHARTNEARVTSLVAFASTSGNPSQGGLTMSYYALNYWQYIDVLVFWGGSAGEGLILAPNPTVINAAHRNGVAVLGNIFLPPTAYGGQFQWVTDLLQKSGATFPVADKLMQVAQYYGFDGWFLNQETAGGSATTATTMRDFIKYIQTNSALRVMWYDAMTESGSISWQNALTTANDMFLQDGGRVSDDMFLNFWWSASGLASSRTRAQSLGRNPYDVYAGVDVEANGYNTAVTWTSLFPESAAHVLSLGFYRPEWTRNSSSSVADFYVRDNRFWVGWNRDPSFTTTTNAWKGVAHYVPAKSPINRLPFVTSFNTGQGNRYAINGQIVRNGEWNNLSLQNVLPTWRWVVQSTGEKLVPDLDWSDAYYGGTSLKVSGNLTATNDLKLFQTSLPIETNTSLRVVCKTGTAGSATYMKVGFAFEDSPTVFQFLDVGSMATADWNTRLYSLAAFAGRKLAVISLRFEAPSPVTSYTMRIGQIALFNGTVSVPAPPTDLLVDRVAPIDGSSVTARLKWTHSPTPVYYYNVFRRNPDTTRTWLGATPNNAYFVPELKRVGNEAYAPVEVEMVGLDFGTSTAATANIFWPTTLISTGAVWKYSDIGANLGTAWRSNSFNDAAWPSGPAMLGYSDANGLYPRTTNSYGADANNKYITTYYRRTFMAEEPSTYNSVSVSVQRDDGAVVYLNGAEVFRSNMPAGTVNYLTLASSAVSGADEATFYPAAINPSALRSGTNLLAVEIHQNTNTSSDIAFDLALVAQLNAPPAVTITSPADGITLPTNVVSMNATASDLDGTIARIEFFTNGTLFASSAGAPHSAIWTNIPIGFHLLTARAIDNAGRAATSAPVAITWPGVATVAATLIPANAVWRYFDRTNDLGESWRSNTFNDSIWASGPAELGFGDASEGRPETTQISSNRQWTTYFRRAFLVADATMITNLAARLIRDDGAVVYLNGAEVWRDNLPVGAITNATPASTAIGSADEYNWLSNSLPRAALVSGTNLLAVEIHQQSTTSSDVSFNFELTSHVIIPSLPELRPEFTSAGMALSWPLDPGLFQVYAATNLLAPTWLRVTNIPILTNGRWQFLAPLTNMPSRYFRLVGPLP